MTLPGSEREIFGQTEDGQSVHRVALTGGGLTANVMTWGASLQDLRLDGHQPPLVLGFDKFDHYPAHSPYFGATPGRYANRIGNATFEIDGTHHRTDPNFLDKHTLHGGSSGTGKRIWQIADLGTSHVDMILTDLDGMMGFPGNCDLTCSYTLKDNGVLQIVHTARTDAPTIAGLAHHSYFNLDGSEDCREHSLQIFAEHYLPVDEELIPTGEIAPVGDTPFDFREAKFIESDLDGELIYDHNFCTARNRHNLRDVAIAHSASSDITLTVASTEPGLQFYAGHKISTPVPGLTGHKYGGYAGFCLEAQNWPDAPNHPDFPSAVLRPDEQLRQVTEYRFSKG